MSRPGALETIAAMAGELRVDSIVMAADGLGYLDHLMLRVLVARVLRLVDVPLLLVKTPKPAELGRWSPAFSR
jgi:nucleotide-binding universal stress UspA family protein